MHESTIISPLEVTEHFTKYHVDGLVQDCSNTLEIWQSCTEPSMFHYLFAVDKAGVLVVSNGVINRIDKLTTLALKQCRRMGWVHFESNHNVTWCKQGFSRDTILYELSKRALSIYRCVRNVTRMAESMAKTALNVTKTDQMFFAIRRWIIAAKLTWNVKNYYEILTNTLYK